MKPLPNILYNPFFQLAVCIAIIANMKVLPPLWTIVSSPQEKTISFDSASWKAAGGSGSTLQRVAMIDALLATHNLKGMTKSEVTTLLGAPTDTEYFKDPEKRTFVYWLGRERGYGVDSEWLVIRFGPKTSAPDVPRVIEYKVVTD